MRDSARAYANAKTAKYITNSNNLELIVYDEIYYTGSWYNPIVNRYIPDGWILVIDGEKTYSLRIIYD